MRAQNILETIGNTPTIRVNRLFLDVAPNAEVWIKSERANPGASIKDRIALSMIEAAEASGELKRGGTIVEPTSGNTGIGLALVANARGYRTLIVIDRGQVRAFTETVMTGRGPISGLSMPAPGWPAKPP